MALSYGVFLIGGGIVLVIGAATYFIGRRSPLGAAAFFVTAILILIALNYV